ncbi:Cna B-type [Calothrix sp. HK-06]|nr:Cna B-type [Calothrix sp. HK-06]
MLYLALPPTPPPIVKTVASQQDVTPTNVSTLKSGIASTATAKLPNCPLPGAKSQKSDLVSSLFAKILAKSTDAKSKSTACEFQKQERVTVNAKSAKQNKKPSKGFATNNSSNSILSQTNKVGLSNQVDLNSQQLASSSDYNKSAQKDAIGNILTAVQELINASLYASVNNTITDSTVDAEVSSKAESATVKDSTNTNNKADTAVNNQANQSAPKTETDLKVASSKSFDASKLLALVQELISASISASLSNTVNSNVDVAISDNSQKIASAKPEPANLQTDTSDSKPTNEKKVAAAGNNINTNIQNTDNSNTDNSIQLARNPDEPFLVEVSINGREIGTIDVRLENKTLLIPLEDFAKLTGFTVEKAQGGYQVKTPLGTVKLDPNSLRQINGVSYISNTEIKNKLSISVELNIADLTLLADLPWRSNGEYRPRIPDLKPSIFAPQNGLSNLRQEFNWTSGGGSSSLRSSTLLGGRFLGGSVGLRLENNFENSPNVSEYYFYKREGQFRYQIGRQQISLHPLVNGLNLTGLQFGYSNLPAESFGTSFNANELLPRRSRPVQTFRGEVPPASFVQLRVGGVVIAQQQVGFNGIYEFVDVNLAAGQNNEIEVLVFDRNNLRIPSEIRTVRVNSSDLLLPSGGNVQLAGVGISGNLIQDSFFSDFDSSYNGKLVGFYQLRQGLSSNLTFESTLQVVPDTLQAQAGLVWRLANPIILSASVGSSNDKLGYSTNLDIDFDKLEINANSQSLPRAYRIGRSDRAELYNHSLEMKYNFSNNFNLGFIARNRQDDVGSASYILPTFTLRPLSTVSLNGRPDIDGRYLFNAAYQPNFATRLAFNTYGDTYLSDLSYKFTNNYQLSFGTEFNNDLSPRYTVGLGYYPNNFRQLSWNLGLALRGGEVAPVAGASMEVLPGLLARLEYQGIPSKATSGNFGGFGDDRFSVTLVSDLSFARGRISPASYTGISKERGAITGKVVVEGAKKNFDLSGSNISIIDKRNQVVGNAQTDSQGNFFIGGLPEGNYIAEIQADELPVELSLTRTSIVAQVANSAVTRIDFPVRAEYGVAGRITDIAGQPVSEVKIELLNSVGARVISGATDKFGLYRLDSVPIGKYTLRVSPQDELNRNDSLPKRQIEISNEFVYNQNLQLPVSAAAKKKQ